MKQYMKGWQLELLLELQDLSWCDFYIAVVSNHRIVIHSRDYDFTIASIYGDGEMVTHVGSIHSIIWKDHEKALDLVGEYEFK